jgi:hypothetical protein
MENVLHVVLKRAGTSMFNDHAFSFDTPAKATAVARTLRALVNGVFTTLRQVARLLSEGAPPVVPARRVRPDEEQPWFHGVLPRPAAEQLLGDGSNSLATNGVFLVRQSERCATDYVLSFVFGGKIYHNKVTRQPDGSFLASFFFSLFIFMFVVLLGTFLNHKNSPFPTLTAIVMAYQTRHDDMQTIITEYVPNTPLPALAKGKPVYQNVTLSRVRQYRVLRVLPSPPRSLALSCCRRMWALLPGRRAGTRRTLRRRCAA